jgi:protein-L-isoaspartate(D-aspartate) O-methyltransferase
MAWRSSGLTNRDLISQLRTNGIVKSSAVFNALVSIDRKNYVETNPYQDGPQLLPKGQTISAPHMHAYALELLADEASRDNASILDVGIGSGYLTAAFARLNPTSKCTGIDVVPELVTLARANIQKEDSDILERLEIPAACNGWHGYAKNAPYDAIHVGAAAADLPSDLLSQLKVNGKMIIPVGPEGEPQVLVQVVRKREEEEESGNGNGDGNGGSFEQQFEVTNLMGVRYVPLVND